MRRPSRVNYWGATCPRKPLRQSIRASKTRTSRRHSSDRWFWAHRTFKGGKRTMLTRRVFLRDSAIVMAGMGVAPGWLARAASAASNKRKTLVAIFMRGAADGLNIVVPFGDKRYRELRPTLAVALPPPQTNANVINAVLANGTGAVLNVPNGGA